VTIAADIIQSGFREGNLIAAGKQPTTAELTEALPILNRFINGIYGYEMGENFKDWLVPPHQRTAPAPTTFPQGNFAGGQDLALLASCDQWQLPPKQSRIIFGNITSKVWMPSNPQDGSRIAVVQGAGTAPGASEGQALTIDGNGRLIDGQPTVVLTSPITPQAWLYRADLAQWITVADVAMDDEMPFPKDFDDFFTCGLAIRLAPRYGKITAAETASTAGKCLARLKARYRQAGKTTYGGENLLETGQSYLPAWTGL
jgi:hypothetical protein